MFVCILPEKAVPEMTYAVSGGTLNPTHSLTVLAPFLTLPNAAKGNVMFVTMAERPNYKLLQMSSECYLSTYFIT